MKKIHSFDTNFGEGESILFTCSYIQQIEPVSYFAGNIHSTQNRNVSFLSELGQSILHFYNQVKLNLYIRKHYFRLIVIVLHCR